VNKLEFINALGVRLRALPPEEINQVLNYYVESIDDRMEDGMSEEAAIEALGDLDALSGSILQEHGILPAPQTKPVPAAFHREKRPMRWWMILLIVLGSPIWLSIGVSLFAVALSLYIVLWALILSFWAVAGSFALGGLAGAVIMPFASIFPDTLPVRVLAAGLLLAMAGGGAMLLPLCFRVTCWFTRLHGKLYVWIRTSIQGRKEEVL